MKKFTSLLFILGLFFSVQAQTTKTDNDSVGDLRKSLTKHSRYQFQNITLQFAAKDFKSCDVSYQFERIGSIGDENFGPALLDRSSPGSIDINSANAGRKIIESDGVTTRVISRNLPQYALTQGTFFNTSYMTTFKLSDLNPDAVEITRTSKGVYLSLKTLESKASIEKNPIGSGAVPAKTSTEFLPMVSQKKAEKVKELFMRAIKQCSEQD